MRRVLSPVLLCVLGAMVMALPLAAQTTNGVITGTASDAQKGVLPGVTVTARNADTGFSRTVVTEGDGRYLLAGLPPGRYTLRAELQGFGAVEVTEMTVTIGGELLRDLTLQVEGVQESVSVSGEAPVVETTRTGVSGVVTQDQMQMLPLDTRQPMGLALLLPGTSQDAVRKGKFNANIGAGAFTMGSGLLVDGVWNKEANTDPEDFSAPESGAVYVFVRSAGRWTQHAYIKSPNADAFDQFGSGVGLSADGATMAVAANGEDSAAGIDGNQNDNSLRDSGAVYVF